MSLSKFLLTLKGGAGSGNHGHGGRPGKRGGSTSHSGGLIQVDPNRAGELSVWREALGSNIPKDDEDNYFYHATTEDKIGSIKESGLTPQQQKSFEGFSSGNKVSLAPNVSDVEYWSSALLWRDYDVMNGKVRKPIIFRVPKNSIDSKKVRSDEVVVDKVPKDSLEILRNGKFEKF